jgi:hypothetical protein
MTGTFGLGDADAFYPSCERAFQPALEGRPAKKRPENGGVGDLYGRDVDRYLKDFDASGLWGIGPQTPVAAASTSTLRPLSLV